MASSFRERIFETSNEMKLIRQRAMTKGSKTEITRIALIEEHLEAVAGAVLLLLEMKEKGL